MWHYKAITNSRDKKTFLKVFLIILLVTFGSVGIPKSTYAETNDNGCNNGDKVTIRYGKSGDNQGYRGEFSLEVGSEGGTTNDGFAIAVKCEQDSYAFETITGNGYSLSNAGVAITKDQISENGGDAGEYITWVGDSNAWGFWISKIEQREDTTNPDTGVPDNAYNPTISVEENKKNGNTEEIDADIDLSEGSDEGDCFDNSGKIGWIICPIITGISGVGEWLWDEIETNFLQIPVGQFFRGGSGIETAWKLFRDMANVVFIILFLFVIFSQLTGIGIDNYGIKKIMPKLIVTAILINLSYVICVLAVDLSNILGTGLNALFTSLASQIPVNVKDVSGGQSLALAGISGGGVVLFGLISGPLGIVSAGLWVFGLIITIAMSMLFLFLILIIRSAGIVILIAIAPIAIVCYMLPNTEKLFKRWLDLLKALLLVYPICGALVGAGKLAGNLLASTNLEAMKVAGMVMEVLPFFLIPTILKQSLSLAGNIGARLSATGKNLGRRSSTAARGAITGSEKFKNWSNFQQDKRSAGRAMSLQARLERRKAQNGGLSERDNERLLKATETVNAYQQRKAQGTVGAYKLDQETAERRAEASLNAQEQKAFQDQFAGFSQAQLRAEAANAGTWLTRDSNGQITAGAQSRMSALLQTMEQNGMERDMASILAQNNVSGASRVMQTLAGSSNAVFSAYGKRGNRNGNEVSFEEFMTGTGNAANTDQTMQSYLSDKGGEAISKLDDKALATISQYQTQLDNSGNATQIMSTDQLVAAAAQLKGEDSLQHVNKMLQERTDIKMTGDQLANMKATTIQTLATATHDSGRNAILTASDDIAKDPKLIANVAIPVREEINHIRSRNNIANPNGPQRSAI